MRKFDMFNAFAEALRNGACARPREAGIPLYLEYPIYDDRQIAPGLRVFDAEDARVEAGGLTIGDDKDDDGRL